jgi:hypothetical protein
MMDGITEDRIQVLLAVRSAEVRMAPSPALSVSDLDVFARHTLVRSNGIGGWLLTQGATNFLRSMFLFCEAAQCDGTLWRYDVVAPLYTGASLQRDFQGRHFFACPKCMYQNFLAQDGPEIRKPFVVVEVQPPPKLGPLSSH